MSDQSKLGLGKIITEQQDRDAIHVAIAPVVAAHTLSPGMHVGLDDEGRASNRVLKSIGVIDPFLKCAVIKGDQCWLFLYPGTITSLRHEWSHPTFKGETSRSISEEWIDRFAIEAGMTTKEVLEIARRALVGGSACAGGDDEADLFNERKASLMSHASFVLGVSPMSDIENVYFSCSC